MIVHFMLRTTTASEGFLSSRPTISIISTISLPLPLELAMSNNRKWITCSTLLVLKTFQIPFRIIEGMDKQGLDNRIEYNQLYGSQIYKFSFMHKYSALVSFA